METTWRCVEIVQRGGHLTRYNAGMANYDVIVVGLGGIGSAALYHLARHGTRVLGIDQFGIAHDRGSSHGETRIIRKAYFEHPDYIPLLEETYAFWRALEAESGETLIHQTGLLLSGLPDGPVVSGVQRAAQAHNLDIEELSKAEVENRYKGFRLRSDLVSLFEAEAGYLEVEHCIRLHVHLAQSHGAQLRLGAPIESWEATNTGVRVRLGNETIAAAALVLCPGPWAGRVLGQFQIPLKVRRKPVFWMPTRAAAFSRGQCPIFCFDLESGFFYGFPSLDDVTVKVAMHSAGDVVANPSAVNRGIKPEDIQPVAQFVRNHLNDVEVTPQRANVCMYTMTPDEHAIVGPHPTQPHTYVAVGMSGHGFKFAPLFGARLTAMALGRPESVPLSAILAPDRHG